MTDEMCIKELEQVVVRFAGDSGDGMQLAGTIFTNVSAVLGNDIATFPDYPAEIRAPQGTVSGVSGFQVHVGSSKVYTSGDKCDVLVAMNPAALKKNVKFLLPHSVILIDRDAFGERDLTKAEYKTDNPFKELGLSNQVVDAPITSLCQESLKDSGLDNKAILRTKNMFALGLTCWLFNRPLESAKEHINKKFSKKPEIAAANVKVLTDGFNYGHNIHASVSTYRIESREQQKRGIYKDVTGNRATAFGLVAAAEKADIQLFLGSYPITPASDILHELSRLKHLGVITAQCEDEIAGCCTALGASFAGALGVTSTSGPGICLKSEAINLAVIAELPLVIIDVQRGGPSTGLPTKSEQTDLLQAMYGRNGESPIVVIAGTSPSNCFDSAFMAAKIALEHMTPVILLTDGYIANGSAAWRIPDSADYPEIKPPYVTPEMKEGWTPYQRNTETMVRYWAVPGTEGFEHRLGGLEKNAKTGAISTEANNHQLMVNARQEKIDKIAHSIPKQEVFGDVEDADLLIVGWGGTFGHLYMAFKELQKQGKKVALAHFQYINPLPLNTEEILRKYPKVVVAEQNLGQFASILRSKVPGVDFKQFNRVKGQPFNVGRLVEEFTKMMEGKENE